ncbi:MAG: hypothetical protein M1134_05220 [Actinobacteria bacterium]|nr:hypothetical protein [Actinomycetota bacterium]MCL5445250.1 hypothetical protein [Actinomycetota bacterium]
MSPGLEEFADLAERIEGIAEELTDIAIERLTSASESSDGELVARATSVDREIVRARRALEKASSILQKLSSHPQ